MRLLALLEQDRERDRNRVGSPERARLAITYGRLSVRRRGALFSKQVRIDRVKFPGLLLDEIIDDIYDQFVAMEASAASRWRFCHKRNHSGDITVTAAAIRLRFVAVDVNFVLP